MKCFRLRCYVNNSFLVFHQGTKHSKTIKHLRFALVFHTVFSCLDPLMKHSNSLFTYNVTSRVKSENFILQTTCHYQYESLFSIQLTHNINFSKKFSPTWRSFNKFTLLVTSSNTQLIRLIIIPTCFWSKYFENQARYEKVVKVFIYN
jgi:hypothetical protein